ncbi:MAG: hypothetical protein RL701_1143 [Pseudomonadota bacterium]
MAEVFEQFGPYKRVRRLGAGGMAETYLAVQRAAGGFEQRVCMKFILPGYRDNADFRRLFLREASIAASLRHSNIVGIIDVDASAGYMVLELVDGVDLRTLLNSLPGRRLPPELATLVAIELCKALAYAHARVRRGQPDGIVHRDVSPSNVLISYAGEIKLTDFGVARAMRADVEPLSATVKGKLCYMSPEQARGQLLDGRSDLFAVGVLCYELLAGSRPFDGLTDAETLLRVATGEHVPLQDAAPHVPYELAQVVERLLCHDRERRYPSADACIDALALFAPPATCFRQLGHLARAARPHETLHGEDLAELGLEAAVALGSRSETQALLRTHEASPRERLAFHDDDASAADPPERRSRAPVPVHRNAWIALGIAVAAFLVVGIAGLNEWRRQREFAQNTLPPVASAPSANTLPTRTTRVDLPDQRTPEPRDVAAPQLDTAAKDRGSQLAWAGDKPRATPPKVQDPAPPEPVIAEAAEAQLTVGVLPLGGRVWIDKRPYGYSPIQNVKLRPGKHLVESGDTRPQVRQNVVLKAGETRSLLLSLENSAGDDATR